jgi:PKHD-type hydroxylase
MSQYFIHIPSLLKPEELGEIDQKLAGAEFVDGKASATLGAQSVKNNLQMDAESAELAYIRSILVQALKTSPLFGVTALPKTIHPFLVSKYTPGNSYGWHVDSPLMGEPPLRTDLAMTVFLSNPDDYQGGELLIQTDAGTSMFKPTKGDAVLYSCQYLHCVNQVTDGTRFAAVTWIQSNVKNPEQRQILFHLNQIHAVLHKREPAAPETMLLLQTHANLFRMWSEA